MSNPKVTLKVELYNAKEKEETGLLPTSSTSFRIHRSSSSIAAYPSLPSEPSTQIIAENEEHSEAFFTEDSSFADYYGALPTTVLPPTQSTSTTSIEIDTTDETTNMPETSPEKPNALQRRTLAALMQAHPPTSTSNLVNSASNGLSRIGEEEELKSESGNSPRKLDTAASHQSDNSLSDAPMDEHIVSMEETYLIGNEGGKDENEISNPSSSPTRDCSDETSDAHFRNGVDVIRGEEDEGNGQLPMFWAASSSLAQTLSESHAIQIIEDDRARFSFDDNVDGEPEALEEAEGTSSSLPSTKKRKRVNGLEFGEEGGNGDDNSNLLTTTRKKRKLANGEQGSELTPVASSYKRENYRKLNLKSSKKGKMDREAMSLARARKSAIAQTRSAGPELSPFDIVDESTVDFLLDTNSVSAPPVDAPEEVHIPCFIAGPALTELRNELSAATIEVDSISTELMVRVLKETFGVDDFRSGQETAIRRVLASENTLLILPTGGGKSLCYQYPTLCWKRGLTIVISPLLSLMADQISNLPSCLCGVSLSSHTSPSDTQANLTKLKSGQARILFISPEKLASQNFLDLFSSYCLTVNLVCIDEAHCISTWSHNFRPAYLSIYKHAVTRLRAKRVLALTATATALTAHSISELLHIPNDGVLRHHPLGQHLELQVHTPVERHDLLDSLLKSSPLASTGSVIVYVMFQRQADDLATYLQHRGVSAAAYHAGKSASERKRVQALFLTHQVRVMVATVAFGMGIDHKDVRAVIHFGMPKSVENYVQEVGRAGRDFLPSVCHLLYHPSDLALLRSLAHSDTQDRPAVKSLLLELFQSSNSMELPYHVSLPIDETEVKYDMRQSTLSTIFTWLANEEIATVLPNCFAFCDIAFHGHAIEKLKLESRLIMHCFALGKRAKGVLTVPLDRVAKRRRIPVTTLCQQLSEVAPALQLSVSFKGMAFNLQIRKTIEDQMLDEIIDKITANIKQIETVAVQKINDMHHIITQDLNVPLHDKIRSYFEDEKSEGSIELQSGSNGNPKNVPLAFSNATLQTQYDISPANMAILRADVRVFLSQNGDRITTARQVARIFHGISSPQFPKEDWQTNKFWNKSVWTPFELIQKEAQEQLIAALMS